jgi:hypothetical protein
MPRAIHPVATTESIPAVETRCGAIDIWSHADSAASGGCGQVCLAVVEFSAVELMAFLEHWDLVRLRRQGYRLEVWVLHCIHGVYPGLPIKSEKFSHQGHSTLAVSRVIVSGCSSEVTIMRQVIDLPLEFALQIARSRPWRKVLSTR